MRMVDYMRKKGVEASALEENTPIEEVLGKEIEILGYEIRQSQFGDRPYAVIDIRHDGTPMKIATSAAHVLFCLQTCKDGFPLTCKLVREGRRIVVR